MEPTTPADAPPETPKTTVNPPDVKLFPEASRD